MELQDFETWFFGGLISSLLLIIGFFLKRNLDKLEERLEKHDNQINDHETRLQVHENSQSIISKTLERTNDLLIKLEYLNGK